MLSDVIRPKGLRNEVVVQDNLTASFAPDRGSVKSRREKDEHRIKRDLRKPRYSYNKVCFVVGRSRDKDGSGLTVRERQGRRSQSRANHDSATNVHKIFNLCT
ncbi:hypothetical protein HRR80_008798 [Exophiala dermatitidis]|uniref:Uncharacterized protein n=1 Tax=Exophiala dermatitidis TaxID=5970 RepID=A0AAN6ENS3_EXODE|nr:hypothetical protein HRR77_008643 [Exophiala dermatitidis]KAJ4565172.1 hypothetical protein HRR82_009007 [Exophiala dermatitidis]KAJ4602031.1 hypothetical protein HRR85_008754 [Exophiala dermatitidis]KAJ4612463.1 hypothetical protein HRR86_008918 [Exophiala dermatitidis]KAJ8987055.1 hypothetical protein HRR80_008798 [Exophiala dermatitidis]